MFRKPTEISSGSSSSAGSSSGEEEEEEQALPGNDRRNSDDIVEFTASDTLSLSINDDVSQDLDAAEPSPDTSYHSHMLMATLLEEHARTRAAELLNTSTPGANYSRTSPDVQPVAQRIFTQVSQMLSSSGVLPTTFASDERRQERQLYLDGLDQAGHRALHESGVAAPAAGQLSYPNNELALTMAVRPSTNGLSALMTKSIDDLNLRPQPFIAMPSPYNDMQLLMASPNLPKSRFRTDFEEVRILGKGGFGQVHQVINLLDNQHYAIKRIPLSSRVSSRWHETGLQDSDNVLREIRTLARLEHCNIVRYYNAWIESPTTAPSVLQHPPSHPSSPSRKLLIDRPALAPRPNMHQGRLLAPAEVSSGVVFDDESHSQQRPQTPEMKIEPDTFDNSATSTVSLRDSEIFTDGRSQGLPSPHLSSSHDSVYVLHLQMSIHAMTLTTYLSPPSPDSSSSSHSPRSPSKLRHCFHLIPSLRLLLGIICGLQYLHAMQIVHRDIKPGNILLSEHTGLSSSPPAGFHDCSCARCPDRTPPRYLNPRIADFGLVADVRRSALLSSSSSSSSPPQKAKVVGTEFYRPAQSDANTSPSEAIDVFALGIVLFELLWPFGTKMERYLLLTQLGQHARLPDGFAARLDAEHRGAGEAVAQCILGMVEASESRRWSCEQVKIFVEDLLTACSASVRGNYGGVGD